MDGFPIVKASNTSIAARGRVSGFGVNDAWYLTKLNANHPANGTGKDILCPFYQMWKGLLRRCYSEEFLLKRPTYRGCSVHPDWLKFSAFRAWASSQPWRGRELDKDLLNKGNKVYGPDTCCFVPSDVNSLFLDHGNARTAGAHWDSRDKKFVALVRDGCGRQRRLGSFDLEEDALMAYTEGKIEIIRAKIRKYENDAFLVGLLTPRLDYYREQLFLLQLGLSSDEVRGAA